MPRSCRGCCGGGGSLPWCAPISEADVLTMTFARNSFPWVAGDTLALSYRTVQAHYDGTQFVTCAAPLLSFTGFGSPGGDAPPPPFSGDFRPFYRNIIVFGTGPACPPGSSCCSLLRGFFSEFGDGSSCWMFPGPVPLVLVSQTPLLLEFREGGLLVATITN